MYLNNHTENVIAIGIIIIASFCPNSIVFFVFSTTFLFRTLNFLTSTCSLDTATNKEKTHIPARFKREACFDLSFIQFLQ